MRRLPKGKYLRSTKEIFANFVSREDIYPFYASFKVTHKCKFRCKFCNVWKENVPDLDTEDAKKVIENLGRSSVVVTSFEGGEPLERDDIMELLKHARKQPFYLLFTTSQRDLLDYPIEELSKYIDFFHVSIDEGHNNLNMFDNLPEIVRRARDSVVCVQTVVTNDDIGALEEKVKLCHEAGSKSVIMPAVHLDNTKDYFPELQKFKELCETLKVKYPNTVIDPGGYFDNILKEHGCSSSSIIIDSDGQLFYPCRTLDQRVCNLVDTDLTEFLKSPEGTKHRKQMAECDRRCGWYQYFATSSFASPREIASALKPYYEDIMKKDPSC